MGKSNNKQNNGDGTDFIKFTSAIDQAKNEKLKSDNESTKLDPEQANRKKNRANKPDVSVKKSGNN